MGNIYTNDEERKKYQERYYTQEGIKTLKERLKTLAKLLIQEIKYPHSTQILGFPTLIITSKEKHLGMLAELGQILGYKEIKLQENELVKVKSNDN